jgi:Complex I intermediate-associated protein 30 (CIA30)
MYPSERVVMQLHGVQGAAKEFGSLDDVVMGGRSESGFTIEAGAGESGGAAGVFSGVVTTGEMHKAHYCAW